MSKQGVIEKLLPGEFVRVEMLGSVDAPRGWQLLEVLIAGGPPTTSADNRNIRIGIVAQDVVIVETTLWGKPTEVHRTPLTQVKVLKCKEGLLSDEFTLDMGDGKPLRISVMVTSRPKVAQFLNILTGAEMHTGSQPSPGSLASLQSPSKPGFGAVYLWGTGGALAGWLIGFLFDAWLIGLFMPNRGEDFDMAVGLLGWVVLCPACFVVGVLAALAGRRLTRDRPYLTTRAAALAGAVMLVIAWLLGPALIVLVFRPPGLQL